MKSPNRRATAWVAVILANLAAWSVTRLAPARTVDTPTIHHPAHARFTRSAVRDYAAAGEATRRAIRRNLEARVRPLEEWIGLPARTAPGLLCLGEDHATTSRDLLATQVFSRLPLDLLMLEATPAKVRGIERALEQGRPPVRLKGADITSIILQARRLNPGLEVLGIDETREQRTARLRRPEDCLRDESMLANVLAGLRDDARHLVLVGAMHCAQRRDWLYGLLCDSAPHEPLARMHNVRVATAGADGAVESFVRFLAALGIERASFVIDDARDLHPRVRAWFPLLMASLEGYQSVMVLSGTPTSSDRPPALHP